MVTHKHRSINDEAVQKVLKSIQDADTFELLALRGHLFIEYWLNEAILEQMKSAQPLLESLNFHQKCLLARALELVANPDFYEQLKLISQIRNRYAHIMFPGDVSDIISKLPLQPKDFDDSPKPLLEVFRWNIVAMVLMLMISKIPKHELQEALTRLFAFSSEQVSKPKIRKDT